MKFKDKITKTIFQFVPNVIHVQETESLIALIFNF